MKTHRSLRALTRLAFLGLAALPLPTQARPATTAVNPQAVAAPAAADLATLKTVHLFTAPNGQTPGNIATAPDGRDLVGATSNGGAYGFGTLYTLSPDGTISTLYSFGATLDGSSHSMDGSAPTAAPLVTADGSLYGTTTSGGANNAGTIYRLDPATGTLTTLASFDLGTTGSGSKTTLVTDGNGNFYGINPNGGVGGRGTIFAYSTTAGTLTAVANFSPTIGVFPEGGLLLAPDGNLYGTTSLGGTNFVGTIFQFNPTTAAVTVLENFSGNSDGEPNDTLVTDGKGNFYGTTVASRPNVAAGAVFELTVDNTTTPPTATYTELYSFSTSDPAGNQPFGGLVFGKDGNLYGTTFEGAAHSGGAVFQLVLPTGSTAATVQPVYVFTGGATGDGSTATLAVDAAGDLFGTFPDSGTYGHGLIFELVPTTTTTPYTYTFDSFYSFQPPEGTAPTAQMTLGADGNFYGTTQSNGTGLDGTVYVYNPKTGVTSTLHNFTGQGTTATDGSTPLGRLVEATPGVFYGTTSAGGTGNEGTIYRLNTATDAATGAITGTVILLYSFTTSTTSGFGPQAGLTLAADGNYYGTANRGGTSSDGTIFQFNPTTLAVIPVANFNGTNGSQPVAGLILAKDGTLYGTTSQGGTFANSNDDDEADGGTVFRFDPAASALTTLVNFNGTDGTEPISALLQGADGFLYGTTSAGGANGLGTVFQVDPATGLFTTLVNLNPATGASPQGALVQTGDGNFYGATAADGTSGHGTVFQFNPNTGAVVSVFNFGGIAGVSPASLSLDASGNIYGTTGTGSINKGEPIGLLAKRLGKTPAGVQADAVHTDAVTGVEAINDTNGSIFELLVAPTITSGTVATGTVNAAFSFAVTATLNPTAFAATGLPAGLTIDPATGLISGTPTATGTSTVTVTASNAGGTATQTLTIVIQPPAVVPIPAVPVINSGTPPGGTVGTVYTYQITASNTPTSYGASGLPPGLSIASATGLISGTPTAAGSYGVVFLATNAGGSGVASYTLTITGGSTTPTPTPTPTPPPAAGTPAIVSAASANAVVGQAFTYQIVATGNPTSFTATGLPTGLTIDATSGSITGAPTATGSYSIALGATGPGGTGMATLTLTVTATAVASPTITSPASASAQVGQAFTYQIVGTDTPASYAASGLPDGLTLNPATGLISGTPTVAGLLMVSLSATNASGMGMASVTLTITSAAVVVPVISSAVSASGQVAVAFSYQITAGNTPVFFGAAGLPAGLSISDTTGLISGTPTAGGVFAVTLMATNSAGTGMATLTLTVIAQPLPVITIIASVPNVTAGTGQPAAFVVTRTGGDPTQPLTVNYRVGGTAIPDVDYPTLKGFKTFNPDKLTVRINVTPESDLEGAKKKTVKIKLAPGDGYTLGTDTVAQIHILAAP